MPRTPSTETVLTVHSDAFPGLAGAAQGCQLVVIEGADMGHAVRLGAAPVIVGTAETCDLVLRDERVSRQHLQIVEQDGRYLVRDLDSRNGTLYEGSLIAEAALPPGATLKVGHSFLRVQPRPQALEVTPSQSRRFGEMVAESLAMREVFAVLQLAAASDVTVLLEGETGTGKELAARAIHDGSGRRRGPFVVVDCGALPASLLESELFGHVRGAFTGANAPRLGAFARADKGTIFLDELSSIGLEAQARLIRVLEARVVRPVGADAERPIDVRVIAASNGLEQRVAEGTFRPDLFYRLSVVRVGLPPLRARREDLGPLVQELLRRRGLDAGPCAGPNLQRLMAHNWPGNVRELRNVVERAIALSPGAAAFADLRITLAAQLGEDPLAVRTDLPFVEARALLNDNFELRYLRDLMARCEGNLSEASRQSGVDRKHLRHLCKKHGLVD